MIEVRVTGAMVRIALTRGAEEVATCMAVVAVMLAVETGMAEVRVTVHSDLLDTEWLSTGCTQIANGGARFWMQPTWSHTNRPEAYYLVAGCRALKDFLKAAGEVSYATIKAEGFGYSSCFFPLCKQPLGSFQYGHTHVVDKSIPNQLVSLKAA